MKLGSYPNPGQPADPRLDLADPRNAGDYTLGSGVVLDAKAGLVLTTYGLIDGARKIYARTSTGLGCYADIHAADARAGLAVVKLIDPPPGLVALPIHPGRTTPGPNGERPDIVAGLGVTALGHPAPANAADGKPVAAAGTLTEVREKWPGAERDSFTDMKLVPLGRFAVLARSDAGATHDCPGAALLNPAGELVALGSPALGVSGPRGGGYAVPMDVNFRRMIDVLKRGREVEYGFLGVEFNPTGETTILAVIPGGPADRAAVRGGRGGRGDTVAAVDGTPLNNNNRDDLLLAIGSALAGSEVALDLVGPTGAKRRVTAVLAKSPHDLPRLVSAGPPEAFGVRADYASVLKLSRGLPFIPPGVAAEFAADSPVAKKFAALVPPGTETPRAWVVTAVDGREVATPDEFARRCAGKSSVALTVADAARPFDTSPLTLP